MAKRRKYLIAFGIIALVGGLSVYPYMNCTGTRERSADFSISSAQVNTYIADLACAATGGNTDQATMNAINDLSTFQSQDGATLWYAEAPSSMGDLSIVAPLDYQALRPDGGGTPQQIYAFFVLTGSGTASLVIGVSDNSGTGSPGPTPTPGQQQQQQFQHLNFKNAFSKSHQLDSGTQTSCSSSNPLNLTTAIGALNDGTQQLSTASYDNGIFEVQMSLDGNSTLLLRSYDVDGGGLQSTIQLEVNQIDPNSGQEIYLGDINLTQPD